MPVGLEGVNAPETVSCLSPSCPAPPVWPRVEEPAVSQGSACGGSGGGGLFLLARAFVASPYFEVLYIIRRDPHLLK